MPVPAEPAESPTAASPVPWFAPAVFLATGFGLGRVPFAPGTFGCMLGLPLAVATGWLADLLAGPSAAGSLAVEATLAAAVCAAAIPVCSRAAAAMGRDDPGSIVLDEVASVPLALLAIPPSARGPGVLAAAFVLLRIFDIGKPFPCRRLERLPAGLGIMADDCGAAAWTAACLAVGRWQHWI